MRVGKNFKGCRGAREVNSKARMQPCLLGNCCLVFDAYLLRHLPVHIQIYEHILRYFNKNPHVHVALQLGFSCHSLLVPEGRGCMIFHVVLNTLCYLLVPGY